MNVSIEQLLKTSGRKSFVPGEGRISGYLSALIGLSCLLGAVCFHFPGLFTTPHLRRVYDVGFLRDAMWVLTAVALFCGIISYLRNPQKRLALTGLVSAGLTVILGGGDIVVGEFEQPVFSFGLDWFVLALLVSLLVFIPLEKSFAKDPNQPILRSEWRTDLSYFFMSHMLVQFILYFTTTMAHTWFGWAVSSNLQELVRAQPVWLQVIVALLLADFGQSLIHRLYHTVPLLWKFHAVHHSAESMDWLAGSRTHIVDVLTTRTFVLVPLFVMGFSDAAMNIYVTIVGIQAVFIHANFGLDFGILNYLVVTPRYHHWHHSNDPAYIHKNYAIHTPLIDLLFGSYKLPKQAWPNGYGTLGKPLPKGLWAQFLYPFQAIRAWVGGS